MIRKMWKNTQNPGIFSPRGFLCLELPIRYLESMRNSGVAIAHNHASGLEDFRSGIDRSVEIPLRKILLNLGQTKACCGSLRIHS